MNKPAVTDEAEPLMEHGYTRCRYGQLHYLKGGGKDHTSNPPLILLHQNPSSTVEYEPFAREMAKDRLVIAFDTPGYGMSDRPAEPPALSDYAGAFAEGLDSMGVGKDQKMDVFGFHTGTYLAVELALARPDLVGRVILSGVPFRPPEERETRLAAAKTPVVLTEDGAAIFEFVKRMWAFTIHGRHPDTPLERAVEIFAERLKSMQRNAWPYIGVWSYEAEKRLPNLGQPVLFLQPHEPLLEHSRQAAGLIAHAQFVEFPNLNKDVFERGSAQFAAEIRAWSTAPVNTGPAA